ncbi:hypothetical protein [Streptomyces flavofungini]|uniref:hypothetical protein n=1 Tax=Streptomyces flavofungini TaxID=68200 RepID=UPI0034DFAB0B
MTPLRAHDARPPRGTVPAVGVAASLLVLLEGVDAVASSLTLTRALLWAAFGVVLFAILWPTHVTAASGLLTARGLVRTRRVRLDRLVSVAWHDGVAQRVILCDTDGNRLEFEPRLLAADPLLWHALRTGVRTSTARGTLTTGRVAVRRLSLRIDRQPAPSIPAPRRPPQ